jgi:hypothetical protein
VGRHGGVRLLHQWLVAGEAWPLSAAGEAVDIQPFRERRWQRTARRRQGDEASAAGCMVLRQRHPSVGGRSSGIGLLQRTSVAGATCCRRKPSSGGGMAVALSGVALPVEAPFGVATLLHKVSR